MNRRRVVPRRWHLLRALRMRPRLLAALGAGAAVWAGLQAVPALAPGTRVLLGWNAGALIYMALMARMAAIDDAAAMQRRALTQDEGRAAILLLVVAAAAAVMLAVGSQLAATKDMTGLPRLMHLALAGFTILTGWLFTQVLFALHYAHDFYASRAAGHGDPLAFPGTADPLYADFLYFACVIGTSGQTADVSFQGSDLRPEGTLHCVLSFFFNATLIALAINIAAGLI